jgi:hypothetical protein
VGAVLLASATATAAAAKIPAQFRGDWCVSEDYRWRQFKGSFICKRGACPEPGVDWLEVRSDRFLAHETECKLVSVTNAKRYKYHFKCEAMEGKGGFTEPATFAVSIDPVEGHLMMLEPPRK